VWLLYDQVTLLRDLLLSITLTDISQENICCLNTALVLLLCLLRDDNLPQTLKVRSRP